MILNQRASSYMDVAETSVRVMCKHAQGVAALPYCRHDSLGCEIGWVILRLGLSVLCDGLWGPLRQPRDDALPVPGLPSLLCVGGLSCPDYQLPAGYTGCTQRTTSDTEYYKGLSDERCPAIPIKGTVWRIEHAKSRLVRAPAPGDFAMHAHMLFTMPSCLSNSSDDRQRLHFLHSVVLANDMPHTYIRSHCCLLEHANRRLTRC